jgi:uncharacterized protein YjgD (DUF1641 family)
MTNEELILAKLEKMESQLEPIVKTQQAMLELKEDLIPLSNTAVKLLIEELKEVEAGFQLEDLMGFVKRVVRNIRNLTWTLKQIENIIEFINDLEPLMKSAVPQIIEHLDQLERRGVFRIIRAMLDVRAKIADAYTPDDIDKIGDGAVNALRLAKKFADPKVLVFLERFAQMTSEIDLTNTPKVGPMRLAAAGFNGDVKEGIGVLLELTKAMAKLKPENGSARTEMPPD